MGLFSSDNQKNNRSLSKVASNFASGLWEESKNNFIFLQKEIRDRALNNLSEETKDEVLCELIMLYLHLVDRISFQQLGPDKRDEFMDQLFTMVNMIVAKEINNNKHTPHLISYLEDNYEDRQLEYSNYKRLFSEKASDSKGTLIWEFSKNIASKISKKDDISVIMITFTIVGTNLGKGNISKLPRLLSSF